MASESTINLAESEFREDVVTDEMKVEKNPRTLQTFDMEDLRPRMNKVSKFSKNIFSQGLINISLLSANATQLHRAQSYNNYDHQTALISLISTSIVLQIFILLLLSILAMIRIICHKQEISCSRKYLVKARIKSAILFLVSILTAVNIFISAYQNM